MEKKPCLNIVKKTKACQAYPLRLHKQCPENHKNTKETRDISNLTCNNIRRRTTILQTKSRGKRIKHETRRTVRYLGNKLQLLVSKRLCVCPSLFFPTAITDILFVAQSKQLPRLDTLRLFDACSKVPGYTQKLISQKSSIVFQKVNKNQSVFLVHPLVTLIPQCEIFVRRDFDTLRA